MPTVEDKIPTGCTCLDKLLMGGFRRRQLSMIYGEAASGKTSLIIQTAASAAKMGLKVIYVDSDHSFTQQRFRQIAGHDADPIGARITLFLPETFGQQRALVESLESYLTRNVGLVIVDSVSSLYRSEFSRAESVFDLNRDLSRQLAILSGISASSNLACLITSQVHARLRSPVSDVEPVARRALFHFPSTIIRIKNTPRPSVREFVLERLEGSDVERSSCLGMLEERGVVDFPT